MQFLTPRSCRDPSITKIVHVTTPRGRLRGGCEEHNDVGMVSTGGVSISSSTTLHRGMSAAVHPCTGGCQQRYNPAPGECQQRYNPAPGECQQQCNPAPGDVSSGTALHRGSVSSGTTLHQGSGLKRVTRMRYLFHPPTNCAWCYFS